MATVTREQIDNLNALLRIEVKDSDYMDQVNSAIKDYSKNANMNGFRKGKVPSSVIKKMYGQQILSEQLNRVVSEELNKYLKDNDVEILGQPLPKEDEQPSSVGFEETTYNFGYELGLAPEFDVKFLSDKSKFTRLDIQVDDEMVQEEVDRLRLTHGPIDNPDKIEDEDILAIELTELEGNEPKEEGHTHKTSIPWNMITDKKTATAVKKMKKEDTTDLDVFKVFDKEPQAIAKQVLGREYKEGMDGNYRVKLININRRTMAEVNQELFDKVFGEGVIKSEDELKGKIIEELERFTKQEAEHKLKNDIVEEFLNKTKFDLPDGFLKKWIRSTNQKPITEEQLEAEYDSFARGLRWSLIVGKITKEKDLKVEESEVVERTKEMITAEYAQYGGFDVPEEQLQSYAMQMLQNEDHVKRTYDNLLETKLFDLFFSTFTFSDKKISYKDFTKLDK